MTKGRARGAAGKASKVVSRRLISRSAPALPLGVGLGIALACLGAARPARADFPAQAVYIGLYGGGNLVLRDWDLGAETRPQSLFPTHGGLGGLRLGVHVIPRLAIEAEVAYLPLAT